MKRRLRLSAITVRCYNALAALGSGGGAASIVGKAAGISTTSAGRRLSWLARGGFVRYGRGIWQMVDDPMFHEKPLFTGGSDVPSRD